MGSSTFARTKAVNNAGLVYVFYSLSIVGFPKYRGCGGTLAQIPPKSHQHAT